MENKEHKLDKLFQEKLSDMEIPLEEDCWPLIEKGLNNAPTSFYRFGWKHFNIYNLSSALLILLLGSLYFFKSGEEKQKENNSTPADTTIGPKSKDSSSAEAHTNQDQTAKNKLLRKDKKILFAESNSIDSKQEDSLAVVPQKEGTIIPSQQQEPVKVVEEEKVKPKKRIIYVVQQDTIVEKDTVKVRKKRKK